MIPAPGAVSLRGAALRSSMSAKSSSAAATRSITARAAWSLIALALALGLGSPLPIIGGSMPVWRLQHGLAFSALVACLSIQVGLGAGVAIRRPAEMGGLRAPKRTGARPGGPYVQY